jgi:hypothetical protein
VTTAALVMLHVMNENQQEWPSEFRAIFGQYEQTFEWMWERDSKNAMRWREAQWEAEAALSDGDQAEFEKWQAKADEIEQTLLAPR